MTTKARLIPTAGETESHTNADLSAAFQLISEADDQFLLAHQEQAIQAFIRLSIHFSANKGSRKASPTKQSQPLPPQNKSITPVSALLGSLDDQKEEIQKLLSSSVDIATATLLKQESEKSLSPDHVLLNDALSSQKPIERALGHRRLGLEYESWELAKYKTSRITARLQDLSRDMDQQDHISEFVQARRCERKYHGQSRKRVEYAIKVLVLERLCQKEVVSVVISFAWTKFRVLKFTELTQLKEQLQKRSWIADTVIQKVDWY